MMDRERQSASEGKIPEAWIGREVMNFREIRRKIMYDWEARAGL